MDSSLLRRPLTPTKLKGIGKINKPYINISA